MLQQMSRSQALSGLLLAFGCLSAFGQTVPEVSIAAALGNLTARAGSVFAGEVVDVRHNSGMVEVAFRIDQSFKGQSSGAILLREWAGLWAAGQRRYWVGERAVFFLNAPGKSGLSSSVDGMEGILPLTPDAASVDVRRLRARVQREAGAPMVDAPEQMSLTEIAVSIRPEPVVNPVLPPIRVPRVHPRPIHIYNQPIIQLSADGPGLSDEPMQRLPMEKVSMSGRPDVCR